MVNVLLLRLRVEYVLNCLSTFFFFFKDLVQSLPSSRHSSAAATVQEADHSTMYAALYTVNINFIPRDGVTRSVERYAHCQRLRAETRCHETAMIGF